MAQPLGSNWRLISLLTKLQEGTAGTLMKSEVSLCTTCLSFHSLGPHGTERL